VAERDAAGVARERGRARRLRAWGWGMMRVRGARVSLARTALLALALAAGATHARAQRPARLVDARATRETRALFGGLQRLRRTHVLYGHQDDLAYGLRWWAHPGRSDVKEVAGSYPAVYGWELGNLELGRPASLDSVDFAAMRRWIVEGYERGGVITISWHMANPRTGGNAWDTAGAVSTILPGGARHAEYRRWLDRFAAFNAGLRGSRGEPVPIIFRPFHEMSGGWFWWGAGHASPDEYRALWRFTVRYLRDEKGVHNLLWAYSPNAADDFEAAYWARYPGDEYVDVLGLDEYFWRPRPGDTADAGARLRDHLRLVSAAADARGKLPALTETGYESIPDSAWWTGTLLRALEGDPATRRIAYVLTWRNANESTNHPGHFYAPYPGHPSAADFVRFRASERILFESDLPDLYGRRKRR